MLILLNAKTAKGLFVMYVKTLPQITLCLAALLANIPITLARSAFLQIPIGAVIRYMAAAPRWVARWILPHVFVPARSRTEANSIQMTSSVAPVKREFLAALQACELDIRLLWARSAFVFQAIGATNRDLIGSIAHITKMPSLAFSAATCGAGIATHDAKSIATNHADTILAAGIIEKCSGTSARTKTRLVDGVWLTMLKDLFAMLASGTIKRSSHEVIIP